MATYTYTAMTLQGQSRSGQVMAEDRSGAIVSVEALGLVPVDVIAQTDADSPPEVRPAAPLGTPPGAPPGAGVRQQHVLHFVRQLGNLLAAGVPLARALVILCRETASPAAARQWSAIRAEVVDGTSLADAMGRFPNSFPPVYLAMVRAGETGGFLDLVLKQIAGFMSRQRELKSKVATALIYPAILATVAVAVVVFLLYWFIPRFSDIYAEFGQSLPVLTQMIRQASNLIRDYGLFVLAGLVMAGLILRQILKTDQGRRVRDRYLLGLPGIGAAVSTFALVRFCATLGTLIGAGVPLLKSLRVARQAVGNQTLVDALDLAIVQVQEGVSLARSLAQCPKLFPGSVVETISVAQETGRLSEEFARMAEEFEQDLDRRLRVLVSLAEPALLFVMASVVGTIVVGMLLPVFDLWDAIQ